MSYVISVELIYKKLQFVFVRPNKTNEKQNKNRNIKLGSHDEANTMRTTILP